MLAVTLGDSMAGCAVAPRSRVSELVRGVRPPLTDGEGVESDGVRDSALPPAPALVERIDELEGDRELRRGCELPPGPGEGARLLSPCEGAGEVTLSGMCEKLYIEAWLELVGDGIAIHSEHTTIMPAHKHTNAHNLRMNDSEHNDTNQLYRFQFQSVYLSVAVCH